jgi:uncharacterized peroxidase-related enzyme
VSSDVQNHRNTQGFEENTMSRLVAIEPEHATGKAKELLDGVHAKLKMTPNMMRVMANSPAVLQAYLSFSGALAGGLLDAKLRELLALTVSEENACQYCVSAHTAIGKMTGLSDTEIEAARDGDSDSPKREAALVFARRVNETKGQATDADVDAVRKAGYSDGEIAEIIAHVALNVFTNYFNNTAGVVVDFPKITLRRTA